MSIQLAVLPGLGNDPEETVEIFVNDDETGFFIRNIESDEMIELDRRQVEGLGRTIALFLAASASEEHGRSVVGQGIAAARSPDAGDGPANSHVGATNPLPAEITERAVEARDEAESGRPAPDLSEHGASVDEG